MINALFIGGPADGRRMVLGDNVHRVSVPEMPRLDSMVGLDMVDNTIPTPIKDTLYHRHDLFFMHGVALFTPDASITSAQLMQQLLDGYRVEGDEKEPVKLAKYLKLSDRAHQSHRDYAEGYNDRADLDRDAILAAGYSYEVQEHAEQ